MAEPGTPAVAEPDRLVADIVSPIWHDERSGARANHASSCNVRRLVGEYLDLCETVKSNDSILSRVRRRMASYSVRINGFARVIESSDPISRCSTPDRGLRFAAKAPPSVQHGGGVNCRTRWRPSLSVPRMRSDCTCSVFSTKLGIVVRDFAHQQLCDLHPRATFCARHTPPVQPTGGQLRPLLSCMRPRLHLLLLHDEDLSAPACGVTNRRGIGPSHQMLASN